MGIAVLTLLYLRDRPFFASDTGTVTFAGWNIYGFGNLIVVNHGNGYETLYAHLSGINVSPGQIVNQGTSLGQQATPVNLLAPTSILKFASAATKMIPAGLLAVNPSVAGR